MPDILQGSVGDKGTNHPQDVRRVYALFNKILPTALPESDQCLPQLLQAIKKFQESFLLYPDGRIDVGGTTWSKLNEAVRGQRAGKQVLLSFDDGPLPENALDSILSTLKAHSIKAEFYVLGSEVDRCPAAAKRIVNQGHSLQNHSYSHADLAKAPKAVVLAELKKTQESIKNATGVTATKIRPPYGAGGWPSGYDPELKQVADNFSLKIENWDIDTEDWKPPKGIGPSKLLMIKQQFAGQHRLLFNVLMHVQKETANDLDNFIAELKKWGYSFATP